MVQKIKKIHFIGIGGIGMSSLAEFLNNKFIVSGSDIIKSKKISYLKKIGIKIFNNHSRNNINSQDLVIYSSAINASNEEYKEAKSRKIKLLSRGEALGKFTSKYKNICIAGTHGKSTTSSFVSQLLINSGCDITAFLGAIDKKIKSNFILGKSKVAVIEADESDNSFNFIKPKLSIITNIDFDHMDFHKSKKNLFESFKMFYKNTTDKVVLNFDCMNIKKNFSNIKSKKMIRFGLENQKFEYYFKIKNTNKVELFHNNKNLLEFKADLSGKHNYYNLIAAIILCLEHGISKKRIVNSLNCIERPKRRYEKVYNSRTFEIIDDYAHHPNEIRAIREYIENNSKKHINYLVFQPHRHSRVKDNYKEFIDEISLWDNVIMTDVYSAFENKARKISPKKFIYDVLKIRKTDIKYFDSFDTIVNKLYKIKSKDCKIRVITAGAGDVNRIAFMLKKKLRSNK